MVLCALYGSFKMLMDITKNYLKVMIFKPYKTYKKHIRKITQMALCALCGSF